MHDVFISYSHMDANVRDAICHHLEEAGIRCWYAPRDILPGMEWPDAITAAIKTCRIFILVFTDYSNASKQVLREVAIGVDNGKIIIPFKRTATDPTGSMDYFLKSLHWLDAVDEPLEERIEELVRYVRALLTASSEEAMKLEGADRGVAGFDKDVDVAQLEDRIRQLEAALSRQVAAAQKAAESAGGGGRREGGSNDADVRGGTGVTVRAGIADYSWAELKALADKIAVAGDAEWLGIAKAYHLVDADGKLHGDTKPLKLTDGTDCSVRIVGFRHDEKASGGKAGITFEFANVAKTHRMNISATNFGGWQKSEMRTWLNNEFQRMLPRELQPHIVEVIKKTNNRGKVEREGNASAVTVTYDRVWLLAMPEVYGRLSSQKKNAPWSPATYDAEGFQYKLYENMGVSTKSSFFSGNGYSFCKKNGASSWWWWLRSPNAYGSGYFHRVGADGGWDGYRADHAHGVSPGFCF